MRHFSRRPHEIRKSSCLSGRATGLVASSNIQHATPAAFSAHWHDRSNYNALGEQQVYQNIDVVLGGGKQYLLPREHAGGKREDKEDLIAELKSMEYGGKTLSFNGIAVLAEKLDKAYLPEEAVEMTAAELK